MPRRLLPSGKRLGINLTRLSLGYSRFIYQFTIKLIVGLDGEDMEIKGKVHCFFEQSGTFKNEFIKLGIPAEDYDIQNNFGQTDHVIDLFSEIEKGYEGQPSIFDNIKKDDLIVAFFLVYILKQYNNLILLFVETIHNISLYTKELNML